jgi:predicted nuclease of predicted toxin-antitoxin system
MKLILDMNLSPKLAAALVEKQINAAHWYAVGKPDATDSEIMEYAKIHNYVVVTCDLDFVVILFATKDRKPSVIQIRNRNLCVETLAKLIAVAIRQWGHELENGAILTLDTDKFRARFLPLI